MNRLGPAAAILIFGAVTAGQAFRLGMGSITQPGPGFFPFWVSATLAVIASVMLIGAFLKSPDKPAAAGHMPPLPVGATGRVAAGIGAIAFLTVGLQYLGFFLATLLFLILCWLVIERLPALRAITVSISCALVSFALFVEALNIHFPRGAFGF